MSSSAFSFSDATLDSIASTLREQDYLVLDGLFGQSMLASLEQSAQARKFLPAAVGRGGGRQLSSEQRGDAIAWLQPGVATDDVFLGAMDTLLQGLNQRLYLGLYSVEAHYAHYPPGAGYRKHRDAFRGRSSRLLSLVLYLNRDWQAAQGGQLRLYPDGFGEQPDKAVDVLPVWGRLVIFLSETVLHEVLAATRSRYSIAAWFSLNRSDSHHLDLPS